jgi:serine protease Do
MPLYKNLRAIFAYASLSFLLSAQAYGQEDEVLHTLTIPQHISSTVLIQSEFPQQAPSSLANSMFDYLFKMPAKNKNAKIRRSQGFGFFVSQEGHIITNSHLVENATKIIVTSTDSQSVTPSLIKLDQNNNIALIKIEQKPMSYLKLAKADKIQVGSEVTVIERINGQMQAKTAFLTTTGTKNPQVSQFEDFIQLDIPATLADSGSPLINVEGDVVGITTSVFDATKNQPANIKMAIPTEPMQELIRGVIEEESEVEEFDEPAQEILTIEELQEAEEIYSYSNQESEESSSETAFEQVADEPSQEEVAIQDEAYDESFEEEEMLEITSYSEEALGEIFIVDTPVQEEQVVEEVVEVVQNEPAIEETIIAPKSMREKIGLSVEVLSSDLRKQFPYITETGGLIITSIDSDSFADLSKLQPGSLIIAVNHKKVGSPAEYYAAVDNLTEKDRLLIVAKHGSIVRFYNIKLL